MVVIGSAGQILEIVAPLMITTGYTEVLNTINEYVYVDTNIQILI